jgi:hypothetical protein
MEGRLLLGFWYDTFQGFVKLYGGEHKQVNSTPKMHNSPNYTTTFLFTDIEGSTQWWELDEDQMNADLDHHNQIIKTTIDTHGETKRCLQALWSDYQSCKAVI